LTSNLNKLVEEIISDSRAKAEEIRRQGRNEIEEEISSAKAAANREADQIVRSATAEAQATKNRLISQATQKARVAYLAERNRILHDLFKELRIGLEQFAKNDTSYRAFLLDSMVRGMEALPSETARVLVSERDLDRYARTRLLEEALHKVKTVKKARFSDASIAKIGGAVVTSEDDKIRVDCTIDARLELMQPQILSEISKALFSD
jgi:vacuolar-type H+-ATPase subunit E/Vma4